MWTRFTERARKVIFFAHEEAAQLNEHYVSTEHLLLGVLKDPSEQLKFLLDEFDDSRNPGFVVKRIRAEITTHILQKGAPRNKRTEEMALTPRAKRAIDLAYDEVRSMGVNYLHDTHLFLGLLRERDGLAGQVLAKCEFDLHRSREFLYNALKSKQTATTTPFISKSYDAESLESNGDDKIQTLKMLKLSAIEAVSKVFDDLITSIQKS